MITVAILINGNPIVTSNAVNKGVLNKKGQTKYVTDCGDVLWMDRETGAVDLAKKLLDTIRNDKESDTDD